MTSTVTSLDRPSSTTEVQVMFDAIAPRYDLLNSLLSGGLHRVWEKRLARRVPPNSDGRCLDLCTGTGALIPFLAPSYREVVGVDISSEMLQRARDRFQSVANLSFHEGDAQALAFDNHSFDAVTVAYGVRNWPERERGLSEIARVLRPGGAVGILEFGQPRNPLWRWIFSLYSRYVIPTVGGLISGSRRAYEYLPRTSAAFPCGKEFEALLKGAGLVPVHTQSLCGGIAYIYIAEKRE
jgi:demethylmenaquinone methyltransferase/2-methoxy-6-polyprenyl-1,4-benzoquinol methylase